MEMGSFEGTCIKCDSGEEVLFCHETGCPVAVHEKCLGSEAVFDDSGKFYCPYCRYKRALARTRELREKAMEAKKELTSILEVVGCKGKGKGKQINAQGPHLSVPEYQTRDGMFFNGKRRRVLWTAEEEEMLKKIVDIISSSVNKNIPWIHVLEYGSHVFHPSRNPTDLKDKWRTLNKVSR